MDVMQMFKIRAGVASVKVVPGNSFKTILNEDGTVKDYQDVVIDGMLSTFVTKTAEDRIGDYVLPGAFTETLGPFAKNPISLIDHDSRVYSAVGTFIRAAEEKDGLAVSIKISNAPDLIGLRFRLVERVVRTLSMGGIFYYLDDGYGIYKVDLFEGSIVAIPMNPDAVFTVRGLNLNEFGKIAKAAAGNGGTKNLRQITIAGRVVDPNLISEAMALLDGKKAMPHTTPQGGLAVGGMKISKGVQTK